MKVEFTSFRKVLKAHTASQSMILFLKMFAKDGVMKTGRTGVAKVLPKRSLYGIREYVQLKKGSAEVLKCFLPLPSMRWNIETRYLMDTKMSYLVYVRQQELKRVTIVVDGDARNAAGLAGKVAKFGSARLSQYKLKGSFLPQLQTVGNGRGGDVFLQD